MNIINTLLAFDLSLLQSARGLVGSQYAPVVQVTGEGIVVFGALFLVGLWIYGVYKKDNEYKKNALTIFFTIVAVFGIYAVINLGLPKWRLGAMEIPGAIAPLIPHPTDNSFPSGHALFTGAFLVALLRYYRYNSSIVIIVVFVALITLVSRVIGGVHYPGDIIGGLVFGSVGAYFLRPIIDTIVLKLSPIIIKVASFFRL